MADDLYYSDRRRLAESGSLGELNYDAVPPGLRIALSAVIDGSFSGRSPFHGEFVRRLNNLLNEHFGVGQTYQSYLDSLDGDGFVDLLEILVQLSSMTMGGYRAIPDGEAKLNRLLRRHRYGFVLEGGQARRIGSPALDELVVGPALLALKREGWDTAENEYRKALNHQRGGEVAEALTAANAAVEAALKAVGMTGSTLGELARSFRGSSIVPGYLAGVPELLDNLLDKLNAARSQHGDAHGRAPGASAPDEALADLAVYWAGAFIAYLASVTRPGTPA